MQEFSNDIRHAIFGLAEWKLVHYMLEIMVEDFEETEGFKDFGFEEVVLVSNLL